MGKVVRFRRRKSERRARARRSRVGAAWHNARPFVLLAIAVAVFAGWREPMLVGVPDILAGEPERVEGHFTRCGPGRSRMCVIDGDTFRVGLQSIRVVGIDTAEVDARCDEEARLAEASTLALRDWLNRGPFEMRARLDDPTDRYGRALRTVTRRTADGSEDRLADHMIEQGGARSYRGGWRGGWC